MTLLGLSGCLFLQWQCLRLTISFCVAADTTVLHTGQSHSNFSLSICFLACFDVPLGVVALPVAELAAEDTAAVFVWSHAFLEETDRGLNRTFRGEEATAVFLLAAGAVLEDEAPLFEPLLGVGGNQPSDMASLCFLHLPGFDSVLLDAGKETLPVPAVTTLRVGGSQPSDIPSETEMASSLLLRLQV